MFNQCSTILNTMFIVQYTYQCSILLVTGPSKIWYISEFHNSQLLLKKDFGSTLAKLNVPEGPFLVVPFLGPKMTRDFSGYFVDRQNMTKVSSTTVNDINLIEIPINVIDTRSKLSNAIDKLYNSPDPYTKMKSYYIQNRRKNVYNEKYHNIKNKNINDHCLEEVRTNINFLLPLSSMIAYLVHRMYCI